MKKLTIYLFSLLMCMSYISCERGDLYYEDYSNSINTYDGDIYSYLEQNKGVFDSLLLVLDRIYPYQDSLKNQDITLFAPTNQSFTLALLNLNTQRRLANNPPIYLEDIDRNELDTLLSRYIFNDVISTESIKNLKDGRYLNSLNHGYRMHVQYKVLNALGYVGGGQQQIVFTDPNNSIFERYWEKTTTNSINIYTKNGVIHLLTPSHNFGFGKLGIYSN